ncbi:MAG: alanine--glyoxylate aminotransferase family protein [Candidatus Gygaella obscura]|nr:alanine--glyoxylate aminotransferase family protein [Candidatus Gygaella obscura]
MKKNYLLTPGPTPLPPEVMESLAKPIIHHRTPQFLSIFKEVCEGLKCVFATKQDCFVFTSSGTGAMESTVANLLSAGDTAICVNGGKFGERWGKLCNAYGVEPIVINVEWGHSVDPKVIEEKLKITKPVPKAVFTTLCETSTGVSTDIREIAKIVNKTDAVLVVDAVSGLGAVPCYTDDWQIDVVVSGSQKGLMIPPGLAFCTLNEKAWKLIETSNLPKFYYDYKKYKASLAKDDMPWTSAISLIIALNSALKLLKQRGLENGFKYYTLLADAVREASKALGLELFADESCRSDAVTSIKLPANIDGVKLVKMMRDDYGVAVAGGQAHLKGKIIRIAHMGYINEFEIIICISCLERVLARMGQKVDLGIGVKAAQEVFSKSSL